MDVAGGRRRLRLIKSRFARKLLAAGTVLAKDGRGDYELWQKRYWAHTIRDDRDFEAHVNYVHINPVRHGHVKRAVDWPHSTLHRHIRNGTLPADWACGDLAGEFGENNV